MCSFIEELTGGGFVLGQKMMEPFLGGFRMKACVNY
jgi:hypothetical protein